MARDHLKRLGDVLAELGKARSAAAGASLGRRHDDALARQMLGKGLARGALARERRHARWLDRSHLGPELILGGRSFQLLQLQLELIEKAAGPLGMRPVAMAVELGYLELQAGDHSLVVGCLGASSGERRFGRFGLGQGGGERRLQPFDVVRHGLEAMSMSEWNHKSAASRYTKMLVRQRNLKLSRAPRAPGMLGVAPIDPLEHVAELSGRHGHRAPLRLRPNKPPPVQPLGVERYAQSVVPKNFDQLAPTPAKDIEIAGMRVALHRLLHLECQPVHSPAHIGMPDREPDAHQDRAAKAARSRACETDDDPGAGLKGRDNGGQGDAGRGVCSLLGRPAAIASMQVERSSEAQMSSKCAE